MFAVRSVAIRSLAVHPSRLSLEELLAECEMRRERRSGPGGQHRNKVETAVVLTHKTSGLQGEASERRSQADNRAMALFRLRLNLAVNYRCSELSELPVVSDLWRSRCRQGRLSVSPQHQDFPALLAEMMDALEMSSFSLPDVAEHFEVTASQLVKLLRGYHPALVRLNQARKQAGLRALS